MSIELTWLGHATWLINDGQHRILLDPFLNDSPTAPQQLREPEPLGAILELSRGHLGAILV